MKRNGFLINVAVIVILIPLLLLVAVYEGVSSSIVNAQSQNLLLSRDTFAISTVKKDFQNALDLSLKRAYLSLTDYVITNGFLTSTNASYAMKTLMLDGTLNGIPQSEMENVTLKAWFNNLVSYLSSLGLTISPSNFSAFKSHLNLTIAPLDSFHIVAIAKINNITIRDSSGRVMFSGSIPSRGFIYATVSITGFEDPLLPASLNGIYTRVINPCEIPYPGNLYGYYDIDNVTNLVYGWCYLGVNSTGHYGAQTVYYPTILNRFERVPYATYVARQQAYTDMAFRVQRELGINSSLPVGIITFLVPSESTDPALVGALTSLHISLPPDYDSVAFYFLNCVAMGGSYCVPGETVTQEYPAFHLDNVTKILVFNTTG
ncbi:hypothetical protein [Thermococcus sp.]|uniref:hypothetical protein n=1 Tax=Thermococcus sp. TaxID=35749 RepID=UPI00261C1B49|nr:hypothetical protein [Thermococcus sp.]